ncbi:MAG TPA: MBL fold metallo-hydrolase [Gemmatimonadaceae bacterium]
MKRAVQIVVAALALGGCRSAEATPQTTAQKTSGVVVRVLDVGQGDATLIENGTSRVLIDGGPETKRMGELLDSLHLNNTTIDVVILTHQHADHLVGLRSLFETKRGIKVRFFFENQDAYTTSNLRQLRDSVIARMERGELTYRDTDDPCANGRPICTITMNGGAKLHIMRPMPSASNPNDRSAPVKLVGPDSAAFSMWFAGDAEHDAIDWFLGDAKYDVNPGMHVSVLKADHHGSCNGVTRAYLDATRPSWLVASVGQNGYGHMHQQAKTLYTKQHVQWYRTDQNGTIEIRSPGTGGGKFSIVAQHGATNMRAKTDKTAPKSTCN